MAMPDPLVAIRAYLAADATLTALVGTRVYVAELPKDDAMPRKCVVIQAASGGFGSLQRSFVRVGNSRFDVRCYGETAHAAMEVYRAVHPRLKHMHRRVQGNVLLHAITPSIEASSLREPDTRWHLVFASYNAMVSEVTVA